VQAIVHAYDLDERTVARWRDRAGAHCQQVHHAIIEQGNVDLQHVQADEIRVKGRSMIASDASVYGTGEAGESVLMPTGSSVLALALRSFTKHALSKVRQSPVVQTRQPHPQTPLDSLHPNVQRSDLPEFEAQEER